MAATPVLRGISHITPAVDDTGPDEAQAGSGSGAAR